MNILEAIQHRDQSYKIKTLKNGLTLLHIPLENDTRFFVSAHIKAGSRLESKKNSGISHFLEHMLFRGSKNFSSFLDIAYAFEKLGGQWNAATSYEYTEFSYSGFIESSNKLLSLFAEFITEPKLYDIEKERKIIIREVEDELNEYGFSTDTHHHMLRLIWPDSSLAQPITGSLTSIQKLTTEELWHYYNTHYTPEKMLICTVGAKQTESLFNSLEVEFHNFSKKELLLHKTNIPNLDSYIGPKCLWIKNSDNQYHLQLSFVCDGEWSIKHDTYLVLTHLLTDGFSSLLSYNLREKLGLVYDVDSSVHFFIDKGLFNINASIATNHLTKLVTALLTTLSEFIFNGISTENLEKAKYQAIADLSNALYSFDNLSFLLSRKILWKKNSSLEKHYHNIKNISKDSLLKTSKEVFCKKNAGLVVMGPSKKNIESDLITLISKYL